MKKIFILFAFSFLFAASCGKDIPPEPEPILPPLTTEGKGTFGCYLNGEPWVAKWFLTPPGGPKYLECTYSERRNQLRVDALFKTETIYQLFTLGYLGPTENSFNSYPEFDSKIRDFNSDLGCYSYYLYISDNNKFESELIKFDLENHVAAGTFSMKLIGDNCFDTLNILDGRFDIKFKIID